MRLGRGEYVADRGGKSRGFGTPKELWGFRRKVPPGDPEETARAFLAANEDTLGIEGVRLGKRAILHGLGATHVILQQSHGHVRVHRGFVTVHIARNNEIYLVKNRASPPDHLPSDTSYSIDAATARARALDYLAKEAGPAESTKTSKSAVKRWFYSEGKLRPAWRVRVHRHGPREEWILYIDGRTREVLSEYDNLAWAEGKARVFDPNPFTATNWQTLYDEETNEVLLPPAEAFRTRTLRKLTGRKGYLDGARVSTRRTKHRVRKRDRDYRVWRGIGFLEAMIYYHLDRAVGYLESLGYEGGRALFTKPIEVDAQGGIEENSHFDPVSRSLQFGPGRVSEAEDAEVILHEFGHALQDAICPDFGQSHQAAAIGEGFGDYLAGSSFAHKKPGVYRDLVMSWAGLPGDAWEGASRPSFRRLDGKKTYADFVHATDWEHENGKLWSATLWEIWKAVGRRTADRIIIDSHFQLDGYTKIVRGARAIIDADVNLYGGSHVPVLRRIFDGRGIRPVQP